MTSNLLHSLLEGGSQEPAAQALRTRVSTGRSSPWPLWILMTSTLLTASRLAFPGVWVFGGEALALHLGGTEP